MSWEQSAANSLGLEWRSRLFCDDYSGDSSIVIRSDGHRESKFLMYSWWASRARYYKWLSVEQKKWDIILLRYSLADPLQLRFMCRYGYKTILVHHTKEIEEIKLNSSVKSRIKRAVERHCGSVSLGLARGIAAVTREIADYEVSRTSEVGSDKPCFIYPNGIMWGNDVPLQDFRTRNVELLFVANFFSPWHGLDRLLDSIKKTKDNFIIHVVGRLSETDRTFASEDARLKLHGSLSSAEIQVLSSRCWVGLSSFASDRKGMNESCTLKVREYLFNGLPVYGSDRDVFPKEFPFYRQGGPDMTRILNYAYETRSIERIAVRDAAEPFISKKVLLSRLYSDICAACA